MNSKRRAELQRKLSMGAVPRPPSDLLDRIKQDIPQYLEPHERERFTGSVAFTMRVAASILMLITTAFITIRLLEPPATRETASIARPKLVPAVTRYQHVPSRAAAAPEPEAAAAEVRLDIAQEMPAAAQAPVQPRRAAQTTAAGARQEADADLRTGAADYALEPVLQIAEAPPAAPVPVAADEERLEAITLTAEAPVVGAESKDELAKMRTRERNELARNAAANASAAAPPPAEAGIAGRIASAPAPSFITEAHASEIDFAQKAEVFGISIDPDVFDYVKVALENGKRPPASSVNVEALVNYFAGPPAREPRRISLEVEASPAPVEAEGDHAVLRFTIDTPRMEIPERSSTPPVARDARLEIDIDPKAVAHFHRIGGTGYVAPESTLFYNLSVTGLYQLELQPHLQAAQHVATVRLRYRSVTDGREHTITRTVRGKDLARDWSRASRRHRLASLGAVWSESLKDTAKSSAPQVDVARRAQELSSQQPRDSRARELANAASATATGGKR